MQIHRFAFAGLAVMALIVAVVAGPAMSQSQPTLTPRDAAVRPSHPIDPAIYGELGKAGKAIPTWTGSFVYHGQRFPFTMIGTDPSKGSATTTIKFLLIPVAVKFDSDGTVLDPTKPLQAGCGTGNALQLTEQSPVLRKVNWKQGKTDLGTTQYLDAFQRANFWNFVSTSAPNYHILLKPIVKAKQTIVIASSEGTTMRGDCGVFGNVGTLAFFDSKVQLLLRKLKVRPDEFPYFLTYDVLEQLEATGYHSVSNANVYAVGSFFDQNIFGPPSHAFDDMITLSHEIGETINDPFGANLTPSWMSPVAKAFGCQRILEVGDPLAGLPEPVKVPGVAHQFYVQDLAFESWFAKAKKSRAANGWFSMYGTFRAGSENCKASGSLADGS
jgi:hypothetical protein